MAPAPPALGRFGAGHARRWRDRTGFVRREIHPLQVTATPAENHLDKGLRGYCKQWRHVAAQMLEIRNPFDLRIGAREVRPAASTGGAA